MEKELSAIIIDDDPLARKILKKFLEEESNSIKVVLSLEDTSNAIHEIERYRPDVLFLDINMPHEDGLRFAKRLKLTGNDVYLIFTTAYQNYALDAFNLKPFDFLVKPFTVSDIHTVLEKVKLTIQKAIEKESDSANDKRNIKFKTPTGYRFISPDCIVLIRSVGNNCDLYTTKCEPVTIHSTISAICDLVKPYRFLRINRAIVINLDFLSRIDRKERICFLNCGKKEQGFHFTNRILSYFDKIDSVKLG